MEKQKIKKHLFEIEKKIEKLEERLMNDEISPATYKKWYRKFVDEKAHTESSLLLLGQNKNDKWLKTKQTLPQLVSLPNIYQKANLKQKHLLLRGVFKGGLAFYEGKFRTPYINPAFSHNSLKIKEKGLLDIEQTSSFLDINPVCTVNERFFEHLSEVSDIINEIIK